MLNLFVKIDIVFEINNLLNKGVIFYGFTLNLPMYIGNIDLAWEYIHIRVEELIIHSKINIQLIDSIYLSIEKHNSLKKEIKLKRKKRDSKSKRLNLKIWSINTFRGALWCLGNVSIFKKNDIKF